MPSIHGEEILGQRCSIAFRISPKVQQTCHGRVTECKASLLLMGAVISNDDPITISAAESKNIRYRQKVSFDNGDELWLDLEKEESEGRLQWLRPPAAEATRTGATEEADLGEQDVKPPPPNKKHKRDNQTIPTTAELAVANGEALHINSDTLQDVRATIAGFVDPSDRNSMALANSKLRDAVEIHSKRTLTSIMKEHAVDDEFQVRIRDQTNIKTWRSKPVALPDRYLLQAAKKTRLYTIGATSRATQENGSLLLALNQSSTCLALGYFDRNDEDDKVHIRIFDVVTKRFVQSFAFQRDVGNDIWLQALDYVDNSIVVRTSCIVRVFTVTGELLHRFQHGFDNDFLIIDSATRHEQNFFFTLDQRMLSFDICSGASNEIACLDPDVDLKAAGVCNGRWLVVRQTGTEQVGVYDLHTECSENHRLEGSYRDVIQCTENPAIFYALPDSRPFEDAHVLQLTAEGKLSRISTFTDSNHADKLITTIQQRLFFRRRNGVQAVSTRDGRVERDLVFPGHVADSIVQNGTEMFVGLRTDPGVTARGPANQVAVAAFLSDTLM